MVSKNPKMFLWPKSNTNHNDPLQFVKLRHPRTRKSTVFLMNSDCDLQEVLNISDGHRSWFLNNHVFSDKCSMRICTPIDKLFLILPYLEQSKSFAQILDLIVDEEFPNNHQVFDENIDISCIADKKESGNLVVYRFSKEKTLSWLQKKIESVASTLKTENVDISSGNSSVNFKEAHDTSDDGYKRFAHGIVSEYISSALSQDLRNHCGLTDPSENEITPNKRGGGDEPKNEPNSKRVKQSTEEPAEDYSKFGDQSKANGKTDTSKMTVAQKKLMNSSKKGMKNIQSFFGRPPKK